jgi:hypothetical protein
VFFVHELPPNFNYLLNGLPQLVFAVLAWLVFFIGLAIIAAIRAVLIFTVITVTAI